jgi:hypothetical protein
MPVKKYQFNLTKCIAAIDPVRIDKDLEPILSIRGLARELEILFPARYEERYITNRLHRASKNGIILLPDHLIEDLMFILQADEKDLIKSPGNKRYCKAIYK